MGANATVLREEGDGLHLQRFAQLRRPRNGTPFDLCVLVASEDAAREREPNAHSEGTSRQGGVCSIGGRYLKLLTGQIHGAEKSPASLRLLQPEVLRDIGTEGSNGAGQRRNRGPEVFDGDVSKRDSLAYVRAVVDDVNAYSGSEGLGSRLDFTDDAGPVLARIAKDLVRKCENEDASHHAGFRDPGVKVAAEATTAQKKE